MKQIRDFNIMQFRLYHNYNFIFFLQIEKLNPEAEFEAAKQLLKGDAQHPDVDNALTTNITHVVIDTSCDGVLF